MILIALFAIPALAALLSIKTHGYDLKGTGLVYFGVWIVTAVVLRTFLVETVDATDWSLMFVGLAVVSYALGLLPIKSEPHHG